MRIFINNHFISIYRLIENKILLNTIYLIILILFFILFIFIFNIINKKILLPNLIDSIFLEIMIWFFPIIIVIILSIYSIKSSIYLNPLNIIYKNIKPLIIEIISVNWKWIVIYPIQKIIVFNELCIPTNIPIKIYLTSNGIMNSLCIPKLGCQMYCMSHYKKIIYILFLKHGVLHGISNNFNGIGYSFMRILFFSVLKFNFYKWIQNVKNIKKFFNYIDYNKIIKQGYILNPKFFNIRNNKIFFLLLYKNKC